MIKFNFQEPRPRTIGIGAFLFPTDKHRLKTQIFKEILSRFFICVNLCPFLRKSAGNKKTAKSPQPLV
ncbi:MAG: hypothetical protein B7Z16_15595 [Algoriphagus sp. 32-45-6]|nr:MAG: hypothetical protein B7Z16_15595 [Algoriphagus sp. 32-45-6]